MFLSFLSLRRLTLLPQRRISLIGMPSVHVKSVIARWARDTQTSIQRWCFVRLAAAVNHAQSHRKFHCLLREKRCNQLLGAITSAWRCFAISCKVARSHLQKKFTFDLKQVCGRTLLMWKQVARIARDSHLKAETKHRFNLLRALMHCWRVCVVSQRFLLASSSRQVTASKRRRLVRDFRRWHRFAKRAIQIKVCAKRLSGCFHRALLRRIFRSWLLRTKTRRILKLSRQIILRDEVAARCAGCIARFWSHILANQSFRNWADSAQRNASRRRTLIKRSTAKRLHLVFSTWFKVAKYCRKRRYSCTLLVARYKQHLQRLIYCAWAVAARRASYARLWLEALCVRWRDNIFVRHISSIVAKWRLRARSRRFYRLNLQRALHRRSIRTSAVKKRALDCWQSFKQYAAHKRHVSKTAQATLHRKTVVFTRCLLSKWCQHSKQYSQMRILMHSLNRACERMLQSKSRDSLQSNFSKWQRFASKHRARRASCFRVELNAQVRLLLFCPMRRILFGNNFQNAASFYVSRIPRVERMRVQVLPCARVFDCNAAHSVHCPFQRSRAKRCLAAGESAQS